MHYSSHHPPISTSDLTLSFICRTTCTICLRVAARFMQCGKDYPPCLHALFCLHTHDVLTNLVNCIFCRRPQKWWAARKELVASEQVKKSHGFWTLKVGFTRALHIQANPHFLYTWALKCMPFDIHNRMPLTQYFDIAETALDDDWLLGFFLGPRSPDGLGPA